MPVIEAYLRRPDKLVRPDVSGLSSGRTNPGEGAKRSRSELVRESGRPWLPA
jgi:hypothetical protein